MDTVKLELANKPLMIAHRGVSGLETENTCAAFVAAGNRSHFGIETDVHHTADGKYVVFHDDTTARVAGVDHRIEETDYDTLRSLTLLPRKGREPRSDIRIPSLQEYIDICRAYGKTAVLELKNHFPREMVFEILEIIEKMGYLDSVIFISFDFENLVFIRERCPEHPVQFLADACDDALIEKLKAHKMDLDIDYKGLDEQTARKCLEAGITLNCWTVDTVADAERMAAYGVRYITSNILE